METTTTIERVTAWAVELPLRRRFKSARSSLSSRRLILIKIEAGSSAGWGEAAPVPGHSDETVERVWQELAVFVPRLLAGDYPPASGMAHAALSQAGSDLGSTRSETPLWQTLGGTGEAWASAAIGTDEDGQPDIPALEEAIAEGYRYAKLKITPDTHIDNLRRIRATHPDIVLGLDANGSLTTGDRAFLDSIDELGFSYIEQPGPSAAHGWHAQLCQELRTPVALDEAVSSPHQLQEILRHGAADIVTLKAGRFGTTETLALAKEAVAAGIRARLGGLISGGVGRAHDVALATCPEFSVVGDVAGSDRYFANDLVVPSWRLTDGRLLPAHSPGIGVAVDEEAVADHAFDSHRWE